MVEYHRPPFSMWKFGPEGSEGAQYGRKCLIGLLIEFGSFDLTANDVSQSISQKKGRSDLVQLVSYFFCMKLGDHKCKKLTEPDFLEKFEFGQKWPKTAINSPKMRFLLFFSKLLHLFFLIFLHEFGGV